MLTRRRARTKSARPRRSGSAWDRRPLRDPAPDAVDDLVEAGGWSGVVDHEVRSRPAPLARGLCRHPLARFADRPPPLGHEPLDRDLLVAVDHDDAVDGVLPRFDQQWHHQHHHDVLAIDGIDLLGDRRAHQRMDDVVQVVERFIVGEHEVCERAPVERPVRAEERATEPSDDRVEPCGARSNDLTGDVVSIDHHGPASREHGGDGGLARTDPAGETYEMHEPDRSTPSPAAAGARSSPLERNAVTWMPTGASGLGLDADDRRAGETVALSTAIRWGAVTVGLLWAAATKPDRVTLGVGVGLLAYALLRTFRPVRYDRSTLNDRASAASDLVIGVVATIATGGWESPYIFVVFTAVIAAGFARGLWASVRAVAATVIPIAIAALALDQRNGIAPTTSWTSELCLTGFVAAYGRRLLSHPTDDRPLTPEQTLRLTEANALLVGLNRLAQNLTVSFDLHDTIHNALEHLREQLHPDVMAVLLLDPMSDRWTVATSEGLSLPEAYLDDELPTAVRERARSRVAHLVALEPGAGFHPSASSAVYVPLWTGERQVGLLLAERSTAPAFDEQQRQAAEDLGRTAALTIDNARWFDKLRSRGAAQERTRLARDLHDRVGQGAAYIAFELDRLAERSAGTAVANDLARLRDDARVIVHELREALYDLRTDVTPEHDVVQTIDEFLARVATRSSLETSFSHDAKRRLPLVQESEVWRIAQEAIVNAERHAQARCIQVDWRCDDLGALLTVADDGVGLTESAPAGARAASNERASYGITGMRERADVVGGLLEMQRRPEGGTIVQLRLGAQRSARPQRTSPHSTGQRGR